MSDVLSLKEKFESQWHEIFAAGNHTAVNGESASFSEADLSEIARAYNEQTAHEAPIVIGHPKMDAPAYGWVEKVKAEGGKLFAKFKDTATEFVDLVSQGRYKKKSIKLYPDKTLVHVGFLGAVPPAVKGLRNAAFSEEGNGVVFEYSERNAFSLKRFMRSIREFLISQFDQETADRIVPDWDIENIELDPVTPATSFSDGGTMGKEVELQTQITELSTKLAASDSKVQEFSSQLTDLTTENANLKKSIADLQTANRESEYSEFVSGLISAGKLPPGEKETTIAFMESLSKAGEMEFADGSKKSQLDAYKEQLSARPVLLEFGQAATKNKAVGSKGGSMEFAGQEVDPEQLEVHQKALELSESEKIPYVEAVQRVLKQ